MSLNGIIGYDGKLPWHLPSDLKRFRSLTLHKPVIMGRKTYESIGKPLPKRHNIVLTTQKLSYTKEVIIAKDLATAINIASKLATSDQIFIIGGATVYRQALLLAGQLYLTRVIKYAKGDCYFPSMDMRNWHLISREFGKFDSDRYYSEFSIYNSKYRKKTL